MPPLQQMCLIKSAPTANWPVAAYTDKYCATDLPCSSPGTKNDIHSCRQSIPDEQIEMLNVQQFLTSWTRVCAWHARSMHHQPASMMDLGLLLQRHDAMDLLSSLLTHLVWSGLRHMSEPADLLLHPVRLGVGSAWSIVSAWLQVAIWTVQIVTLRAGQVFEEDSK